MEDLDDDVVIGEPKRVYIISVSNHDYSDSLRFGQPVEISRGNMNPFQVDDITRVCAKGIASSTPDDYLLLSGNLTICGIASTLWLIKNGKLNMLIFSGIKNKYIARTVTLPHIQKLLAEEVDALQKMEDV